MKAKTFFYFLLCALASLRLLLMGGELVTFEDLQGKDRQEVELRGFLYRSPDGRVILANEPNLKTCCVGSSRKISSQLVVKGDFPSNLPSTAVTMQGHLTHSLVRDDEGNLIQSYQLTDARVLTDVASGWRLTWMMLIMGLCFGLFLFWHFFKRTR